jgi:uncharacterized cysteine cluster protein YcgN (CxxCxxCC family)
MVTQDSVCKQCGRCCEHKVITRDGRTIPSGVYCQFFDKKTRKCSVFHKRFEVNPACLEMGPALAHRLHPNDCGYVKYVPGYSTVVDYSSKELSNE